MKKHLQKYLFEEKVCNLVTEISSKRNRRDTGAEYKCYFKKKNYRADRRRFFLPAYS